MDRKHRYGVILQVLGAFDVVLLAICGFAAVDGLIAVFQGQSENTFRTVVFCIATGCLAGALVFNRMRWRALKAPDTHTQGT